MPKQVQSLQQIPTDRHVRFCNVGCTLTSTQKLPLLQSHQANSRYSSCQTKSRAITDFEPSLRHVELYNIDGCSLKSIPNLTSSINLLAITKTVLKIVFVSGTVRIHQAICTFTPAAFVSVQV